MADQIPTRTRPRPNGGSSVTSPTGTIIVTRSAYGEPITETEEVIQVPKFVGEVARIRVEGGITKNMGDFNSARVSVSVDLPCYPEMSEITRVGTLAARMVHERINKEYEAIKGNF